MLEGRELLDVVLALAGEQGLTLGAAAPIEAAQDERFSEWLERGFEADMTYMSTGAPQRLDPAKAYAPYVSIITFLLPYETARPEPSPKIGNIARYALGDDYHRVAKRKLHAVLDALRERDATLEGRALVDTAPLLEKVAAARAGLGWQGKHSNLIRQGEGSWFLLCEILLNRPLPASLPAKDRCGVCVRCIDVCPTRAIVAPYVVDSRRCISYLTIEHRGSIPEEFRAAIGNRIFGCDDCQEVCPWNRLADPKPLEEFRRRPGLRERTLVDWMVMDIEAWRRAFRNSAVKRVKFEGFKRNVAVALGNSSDAAAIPVLEAQRAHESPLVQEHIDWALDRLRSEGD
ncbi:MAG TPA: tRNA epoxyqueuosine(34) reductase QueG [Planctomycetes bacterium]|nr:tRNA epoxyqueuosine(34) reductase QueG [Planctomycetota bacterium]